MEIRCHHDRCDGCREWGARLLLRRNVTGLDSTALFRCRSDFCHRAHGGLARLFLSAGPSRTYRIQRADWLGLDTAIILTGFIGLPLITDWFDVSSWASYNSWISLAASVLINGFIYTTIMYISIRIWVYRTPEYDERMDGIVYGTVAGLGVATMLNLHYIIDNQGVALAPGIINVVTTALAQASFGGVLGYFMAQAKFEHKPVYWVPSVS